MKTRLLGLIVIFAMFGLGVFVGSVLSEAKIRTVYVQQPLVSTPTASVSASPTLSPSVRKVIVSPTKKLVPTVPFTISPTR